MYTYNIAYICTDTHICKFSFITFDVVCILHHLLYKLKPYMYIYIYIYMYFMLCSTYEAGFIFLLLVSVYKVPF